MSIKSKYQSVSEKKVSMNLKEFKNKYSNNINDPTFLLKIEKSQSWPTEPIELKKYYDYLNEQKFFTNINIEYSDLFYKLYSNKIVEENMFFKHIFHHIESLRNSNKPIIISPTQKISFILTIAGESLIKKDFDTFLNIILGGYNYLNKIYNSTEEIEDNFFFAITHSNLFDNNHHLPTFTSLEIKDISKIIDHCENQFIKNFIIYILSLTSNSNNEYQLTELANSNKDSLAKIIIKHSTLLDIISKKHNRYDSPSIPQNTSDLLFEMIEPLIQKKNYADAIAIITKIPSNSLCYYFLTDSNREFSNQLAIELLNKNLFFFYNSKKSLEQFDYIFYLKENKLEDDFINNVLCHNRKFNNLYKNTNYSSLVKNPEFNPEIIKKETYNLTIDFKEAILYCFIQNGFDGRTETLNYITLNHCISFITDNEIGHVKKFLENLSQLNYLNGFKESIEIILNKGQLPETLDLEFLKQLIFEQELKNTVPKNNQIKHHIAKF